MRHLVMYDMMESLRVTNQWLGRFRTSYGDAYPQNLG